MGEELASIAIGTSGLLLACLVALLLTLLRAPIATEAITAVRNCAVVLLILQTLHFIEEYLFQFYIEFPFLLGLQAWPEGFFVTFNSLWILIWGLSIAGMKTLPRASLFPIWYLAIASLANGVVHPLIAIVITGYFPGLLTSLFVGFLGLVLLRHLLRAT